MKKKIAFIILLFFVSFFININNTYAFQKMTCKYLLPYDGAEYSDVTYSTADGTKHYNLNVVINGKSKSFKSSRFNELIKDEEKCPNYVEFSGTANKELKKSSQSKFIDALKSNISGNNINSISATSILPLYTSDIDSKTTNSYKTTFKTYLNATLGLISNKVTNINSSLKSACGSDYTKYIDKANYSDVDKFTTYISNAYGSVSPSSADKNINKKCWNARKEYATYSNYVNNYVKPFDENSDFEEIVKSVGGSKYNTIYEFAKLPRKGSKSIQNKINNEKLEQSLETDISTLNSNRCEALCMSNNASADSACKSTSESYKNCINAFNSCSNIQDTTAKTACLENSMGKEQYSSLMDTYNQKMSDLQDQLDQVRYKLDKGKVGSINVKFKPYKLKCSDVSILHEIWVILLIIAPFLTILMGVLDFSKAVIASDEQKIHESWKKFPKRLLAAIIVFAVPTLISIIVGMSSDKDVSDKSLLQCIISGE